MKLSSRNGVMICVECSALGSLKGNALSMEAWTGSGLATLSVLCFSKTFHGLI